MQSTHMRAECESHMPDDLQDRFGFARTAPPVTRWCLEEIGTVS
jgi:hypothetical protein